MKDAAGYLHLPRAGGGPRRLLAVAAAVLVVAVVALVSSYPAAAQGSGTESGICGRTEEVRDAILDELSNISDCADVTDSDLSGISGTMHLSGNSSLALKDGDFDGMSGLDVLFLNNNGLASLPDGALSGLSRLRELYLHNNSLTTLSSDSLNGLSNLEKLQLSNNSLSTLPSDVFDDVRFLSRLNLSQNSLGTLPDGIFDGLSTLLELHLTNNPGAPFTFTAELQLTDDEDVVVKVAEGVPFDMTVALSAEGGTLGSSTVTLNKGSTTSASVTVTPGDADNVTVSVSSADFAIDTRHQFGGIRGAAGDDLIIVVNNPATGVPTISGTAEEGSTLTADTSDIADDDGIANATFSYQWLWGDPSVDNDGDGIREQLGLNNLNGEVRRSGDTEIDGATGSTYLLQSTDATKTIKVTVSFTDDDDFQETLTSAATAAVGAGGL